MKAGHSPWKLLQGNAERPDIPSKTKMARRRRRDSGSNLLPVFFFENHQRIQDLQTI